MNFKLINLMPMNFKLINLMSMNFKLVNLMSMNFANKQISYFWWILRMPSFLIGLGSTEKSFTVTFKENMQFIFLCNTQKSSGNVCLMKILKSNVHKKSNSMFLQLRWRKLLKVAAFVIFPTPIMVVFEIHQRFKVTFSTICAYPKEISLCLSFVKSFDTLPKQKLY